jgi:hypothetical protein
MSAKKVLNNTYTHQHHHRWTSLYELQARSGLVISYYTKLAGAVKYNLSTATGLNSLFGSSSLSCWNIKFMATTFVNNQAYSLDNL